MTTTNEFEITPMGFEYDPKTRRITMPNKVEFFNDPKHPNEYHWGTALDVLEDLHLDIDYIDNSDKISFTLLKGWALRPYQFDKRKTSVCDASGHSQLILGLSRKTNQFIARVVTWVMFTLSDKVQSYNETHTDKGMIQFHTQLRHPEQLSDDFCKHYYSKDKPSHMTGEYFYTVGSNTELRQARKNAAHEALEYWESLPYRDISDEQDNED